MVERLGETEFPGDEIVVESTSHTLEDYRSAPSGEGPLAHEWSDKPHRLVYDLINEIKRLNELLDQ